MTTPQPEQQAQVFTNKDRGIEYANYAGLKFNLRIESSGMKTRLSPIRPKLAEQFGLRPRAPFEAYIAHCEEKMQEILDENNRKAATCSLDAATLTAKTIAKAKE